MTHFEAVKRASRAAMAETIDAEPLSALAYVDTLPLDYQVEARAAVRYVYDHSREIPLLRKIA